MKKLLLNLFLISSFISANGQSRDNIFADVGYVASPSVGISATYSRQVTGHLGIGGGAQTSGYNNSLKTAVFADLRKYWSKEQHAFFLFLDLGGDFLKGKVLTTYTEPDRDFYLGFGFGYLHTINKKGWGPYATFKFATDSYVVHQENGTTKQTVFNLDGSPTFSIGFKF